MITVEAGRTALLVMDVQSEIVAMFGAAVETAVARTADVVAAARKARLPIIYVAVGFRPGHPEMSPRNQSYALIAQGARFVLGAAGPDIAPAVRPAADDIVVVKHRTSAFAGTDLEMILRAKGLDTLILTGIATSGVVLSTVRHGADADYRLVVVKDACADRDEEVHRVLTEKVFPRQATVVTAAELVQALGAG
jgi:nicotinamidase-related amidase